MNRNFKLPNGGGLKSGGTSLRQGKGISLPKGGGMSWGGGMKGINSYKFDDYDDLITPTVLAGGLSVGGSGSGSGSASGSGGSGGSGSGSGSGSALPTLPNVGGPLPTLPPTPTPSTSAASTPPKTPPPAPTPADPEGKHDEGKPRPIKSDLTREQIAKLKALPSQEDEGDELDTMLKEIEEISESFTHFDAQTKSSIGGLLDELSDPTVTGNTVKYHDLRKRLAAIFEGKLDKSIATGVLGLTKIADDAAKLKGQILSVLPSELTPDKYKSEAKREASNSAPPARVEVFTKLQGIGITQANYEDKLNNPAGATPQEKVKTLTDMRNHILDAFNVTKDPKLRSGIVPAHSSAKKDATLGETNDNTARARLLKRDLIAFIKTKLDSKTDVKKGDTPAKRPKATVKNEPTTLGDLTQPDFVTVDISTS
jgi:hypothetical protein